MTLWLIKGIIWSMKLEFLSVTHTTSENWITVSFCASKTKPDVPSREVVCNSETIAVDSLGWSFKVFVKPEKFTILACFCTCNKDGDMLSGLKGSDRLLDLLLPGV